MMRRATSALILLTVLIPSGLLALGLGNIEVKSALNEPLAARIDLRSLQPGDVDDMDVSLGTPAQFARAGIERPFVLSSLSFSVVDDGGGRGAVVVTTKDPVAEPFLNFLIEVNWARGRVIREYTVLLDPPVYGAAISSRTRQQVVTVEREPPLEQGAGAGVAPASGGSVPGPASPSAAMMSGGGFGAGDEYGPVSNTDTLWSIAELYRSPTVSVHRMMLAILEANPEAFSIQNVNALREGAVLRIPAAAEIGVEDTATVMAELRRQNAAWEDYRQTLGLATPRAAEPAAGTAATGGSAGAAPGSAPAPAPAAGATEGASGDGQLTLVGSGTAEQGLGGAAGAATDVQALRQELTLAQEEADSRRRENEELSSRLAEAEQLITDLQRLVELKDANIAELQAELARAAQPGQAPEAAPAPQPEAMAPAPAQPPAAAPAPAPAPPTPPVEATAPEPPKPTRMESPPPSFLDTVEDMLGFNPLVAGVALLGVLLAGLGGAALVRRRRRRAADEDEAPEISSAPTALGAAAAGGAAAAVVVHEEKADEVDNEAVTEVPGGHPSEAQSTVVGGTSRTPASEPEDDPLAEVNVYLAYERYDQAESLIKDAIEQYPDRHEYWLRLLEVYRDSRNIVAFEQAAGELREVAGEDSDFMTQARAYWSDLGTGRELFDSGSGTAADDGDADSGTEVFDVTAAGAAGAAGAAAGAAAAADADGTGVDFDLGFEMTSEDDGEGSKVDFDLGLDDGDGTGTGSGSGTAASDLDFSLDDGDDAADDATQTGDLDFDLGSLGGVDDAAQGDEDGAPDTVKIDGGATSGSDVDFDLGTLDADDAGTDPGALIERAAEAGQATGGDDVLDFDLGTLDGAADDEGDEEIQEVTDGAAPLDVDPKERPGGGSLESTTERTATHLSLGEAGADEEGAKETFDFDVGHARDAVSAGDDLDFSLDAGEDAGDEPEPTRPAPGAASGGIELPGEDEPSQGEVIEIGVPDEPAGADADSELDLDLGFGAADGDPAASGDDDESGLDITLEGDAPASGEDDGLDLDLTLAGDPTAAGDEFDADGLDLNLDDGEETPPEALDTVKIGAQPDDGSLSLDGDDTDAGELGIDTEFRGIFGDDDDPAGDTSEADGLGLDLDLGDEDSGGISQAALTGSGAGDDSLPELDLDLDSGDDDILSLGDDDEEDRTLALGRGAELDDVQTKLDLAQAYIDMEDHEAARGILGEVMAEGSAAQQEVAKTLLSKLS